MLLNIFLVPHFIPTSTPILPDPPRQEVVLFVGYPCLGKSTIYRRHFQPVGYTHINQDTLKTRDKCVKVLKEALQAGQSCIIGKIFSSFICYFCYLPLWKTTPIVMP